MAERKQTATQSLFSAAGLEQDAPPSGPTRAALDAALEVFKGLGATVRPVSLPPLQDYEDCKKIIAIAELFAIHAKQLREAPERFGASLRWRIACIHCMLGCMLAEIR